MPDMCGMLGCPTGDECAGPLASPARFSLVSPVHAQVSQPPQPLNPFPKLMHIIRWGGSLGHTSGPRPCASDSQHPHQLVPRHGMKDRGRLLLLIGPPLSMPCSCIAPHVHGHITWPLTLCS